VKNYPKIIFADVNLHKNINPAFGLPGLILRVNCKSKRTFARLNAHPLFVKPNAHDPSFPCAFTFSNHTQNYCVRKLCITLDNSKKILYILNQEEKALPDFGSC